MSFQAYLDNIQTKTGKGAADFRRLATDKGFAQGGKLKPGVKAGAVVAWLKADLGLGHGHAMAIVALLKGKQGDSASETMKRKSSKA
jgi:Domain of unknown function (DUF4287)